MEAVSAIEYSVLTEDQRQRHGDPHGQFEDEGIASVFNLGERPKVGWCTHMMVKCHATVHDDRVVYDVGTSAHRLLYTTMSMTLPLIQVKSEYARSVRVCWPPYVAHHIIRHGELRDGGERLQVIQSVWLDFYAQYFIEQHDAYNKMTGNVPELTQWSTRLPSRVVMASHPWFYTQNLESSIPLDAEREGGGLFHTYVIRKYIADLLRMQIWSESQGAWVDIRPNMKYLVDRSKGERLPIPDLWACIANRSRAEHLVTRELPLYIEYLDVTYEEEHQRVRPGESGRFSPTSHAPCECLFIGAKLYNHAGIEYIGNYSTNALGPDAPGADGPYQHFAIKYREMQRGSKIPADLIHFNVPIHHFPSTPRYPGYYAIPFALRPGDIHERQTGIPLRSIEAQIEFSLKGSDIASTTAGTDSSDEEEEDVSHLDIIYAAVRNREKSAELTAPLPSASSKTSDVLNASGDRYIAPPAEYRVFFLSLIQCSVAYVYDREKGRYVVARTVEEARARISRSYGIDGIHTPLAMQTPRVAPPRVAQTPRVVQTPRVAQTPRVTPLE